MSNKFEDLLETMEWFESDNATGQAMLYVIETRVKDIERAHAETHGNYLPAPNSPEAKRIEQVTHKAKMTAVYGHLREFEKKLETPESEGSASSVLDARSADEILYDVLTLRQLLEEFKLGSDINREKSRMKPIDFFHTQIDLIAAKQFRQSGVNDARIIEYLGWNPLPPENPGKIQTSRQSHDPGL